MKQNYELYDAVFWQMTRDAIMPCDKDFETEVAIVGGGIAGLSAAQEAVRNGKRVALFEQSFCGSGATGKSSGFVVSNAELSFTDFVKRYDQSTAHAIWDFINRGVQDIAYNITQHRFECDYVSQDAIVLATRMHDLKKLQKEGQDLAKIGYSATFYDRATLPYHIGSERFFGGMVYHDTLSMNAYRYCQELKRHLQSLGVLIFEETRVLKIENDMVITSRAKIQAQHIIVCVDRFFPQLDMLNQDVYHAQTYVMVSKQLREEQINNIFPQKSYMAWDTELIYNYFRLTSDHRLLLGGGDIFTTYLNEKHHYHRIVKKLTNYIHRVFPKLEIEFEYMWPGLIGLSKDIGPIAGRDKKHSHIYYVAAATGLSIAAALGRYSIEHLCNGRTDLDHCFNPYRRFPISGTLQTILGTKLSFALSNIIKQNIP